MLHVPDNSWEVKVSGPQGLVTAYTMLLDSNWYMSHVTHGDGLTLLSCIRHFLSWNILMLLTLLLHSLDSIVNEPHYQQDI